MKVRNIVFSGAMASILMIGAATAADKTDVTFAGKFSTTAGEFAGDVSSPISEPVKSDSAYNYTNPAGSSVGLDTEGTDDIVQSDYKGTSSATLEPDTDGVSVKNTDLVSGMTMDASNYQYKFGEGEAEKTFELKLNEAGNAVVANNQFTQEVNLLPDEHSEAISVTKSSIVATNGNAEDVAANMFVITDSEQEYSLKDEGGETGVILVKKGTNEQVIPTGNLVSLLEEASGYYTDAKSNVSEAKGETGEQVADEIAIANKAFAKYTADKSTLAGLNANYKSLVDAKQNFANDYSDFESSEAAINVFDAPILTTIENGANEAINVALGEDGAIKAAVNAGDAVTLSSATSYADEQDAITLASAREYSDTNLASAKSYADERDAITLASANSYTDLQIAGEAETRASEDAKLRSAIDANRNDIAMLDSKMNDLDENLSAGIASSVALSSVAVANVQKGEMSVGGGYGNYNSKSAMAFGAALGITDNWSANAGVGFGFGKDTKASFRVGTNYKFKLF